MSEILPDSGKKQFDYTRINIIKTIVTAYAIVGEAGRGSRAVNFDSRPIRSSFVKSKIKTVMATVYGYPVGLFQKSKFSLDPVQPLFPMINLVDQDLSDVKWPSPIEAFRRCVVLGDKGIPCSETILFPLITEQWKKRTNQMLTAHFQNFDRISRTINWRNCHNDTDNRNICHCGG
jgi:hypothetical protein